MDKQTLTHQTGQARGNLMRLEQDLSRAKGSLEGATRNRMIGGIVLLIGIIALIGFLLSGSQVIAVIAAAGLLIGGPVFYIALQKVGWARRSTDAMTAKVTSARSKLEELKAQAATAG